MASKQDLRIACNDAFPHLNAAIDALLAPFRGPDGNCRPADPSDPAEVAAWDAVCLLQKARDRHLDVLERATRG